MLQVHSICKSYGADAILKDISFNLNKGERLGLVGPNGCGKSTLKYILSGEEKADRGYFQFSPPNIRIGYLPQGLSPQPEQNFIDYLKKLSGDPDMIDKKLEHAARLLSEKPNDQEIQSSYDHLLFELEQAIHNTQHIPAVLSALGLDHLQEINIWAC